MEGVYLKLSQFSYIPPTIPIRNHWDPNNNILKKKKMKKMKKKEVPNNKIANTKEVTYKKIVIYKA